MTNNALPPELYDNELKRVLRDMQQGTVKTQQEPWLQARRELLQQLCTARHQQKLTQADLAEKVGISQSSYARIEAGRVNPTLKTLLKIADSLHVEFTVRQRP
ncbi:hypothetical protein BH09PAT3_BH09PAT3_7000 [soil metagenome]